MLSETNFIVLCRLSKEVVGLTLGGSETDAVRAVRRAPGCDTVLRICDNTVTTVIRGSSVRFDGCIGVGTLSIHTLIICRYSHPR